MDSDQQSDRMVALILAGMPTTYRRLLAAHRPGDDGLCRGCQSQVRLAARWPCALYHQADAAARIADPGNTSDERD
jgi:hypothetical protein